MSEASGDLSAEMIGAAVVAAGLKPLAAGLAARFVDYYALLTRWNARTNLTSIRSVDEALQRHFVECIFCAQQLPEGIATLLDYGSGAGFPGIPIALCRAEIRVVLAESQKKKAAFLKEAVRILRIDVDVFAGRVEEMEVRTFDCVALRAVDKMELAIQGALERVNESGFLVVLGGENGLQLPQGLSVAEEPVPGMSQGRLIVARRISVPRGT